MEKTITTIATIPEASGIYIITHADTNDSYVGQAENLRARIRTHLSQLSKLSHPNARLNRLAEDRGYDGFDVRVLELCDECVLNERERFHIAALNPTLNVSRGGNRTRRAEEEVEPTGGIRIGIDVDERLDSDLSEWAEREGRSKREHVRYMVQQLIDAWNNDPLILQKLLLYTAGDFKFETK